MVHKKDIKEKETKLVKKWQKKAWSFFNKKYPLVLEEVVEEIEGHYVLAHDLVGSSLGRHVEVNTSTQTDIDWHTSLVVGELHSIRREYDKPDVIYLMVKGENFMAYIDVEPTRKVFVF